MNYPPELYIAVAAFFGLLKPIAFIALHLIKRKFPLQK
jgi:hypothetical protein